MLYYFHRKSRILAGANVFITEGFSKKVKDKRSELQNFMNKMKMLLIEDTMSKLSLAN